MKIGIVGSEGAKFTDLGCGRAVAEIADILCRHQATHVVSGHCHLGGIDIWAEEVGQQLGLQLEIYPPKTLRWEGGYKQRNLQIAQNSDIVYCLAVDSFPPDYKGMRFPICYHCKGDYPPHIKSGGCWTTKQARKLGKEGRLIIIHNA